MAKRKPWRMVEACVGIHIMEGKREIARIYGNEEFDRDNAHLIAAAKELLLVCQMTLDWLKACEVANEGHEGAIMALEAAIAKAAGEAPAEEGEPK